MTNNERNSKGYVFCVYNQIIKDGSEI